MTIIEKFWTFNAVGALLFIWAMLKSSGDPKYDAVAFGIFLVLGIGSFFFRCPRCRRPIILQKNTLMAGLPRRTCGRCGEELGRVKTRKRAH
jgi:hypothetical protein